MIKQHLVKDLKLAVILLILFSAGALIYLVYDTNQARAEADKSCEEAYPSHTEVVGIVGLDIGTACFDESGGTVKFLGMLEE